MTCQYISTTRHAFPSLPDTQLKQRQKNGAYGCSFSQCAQNEHTDTNAMIPITLFMSSILNTTKDLEVWKLKAIPVHEICEVMKNLNWTVKALPWLS